MSEIDLSTSSLLNSCYPIGIDWIAPNEGKVMDVIIDHSDGSIIAQAPDLPVEHAGRAIDASLAAMLLNAAKEGANATLNPRWYDLVIENADDLSHSSPLNRKNNLPRRRVKSSPMSLSRIVRQRRQDDS